MPYFNFCIVYFFFQALQQCKWYMTITDKRYRSPRERELMRLSSSITCFKVYFISHDAQKLLKIIRVDYLFTLSTLMTNEMKC